MKFISSIEDIDNTKYPEQINKHYVLVKLFSFFPFINRNKDTFLREWITEDLLETLKNTMFKIDSHSFKKRYTEPDAGLPIGTIIDVYIKDDGVYCVVQLDKQIIKNYGYENITEFINDYDVSVDAIYDKVESKYYKQTEEKPNIEKDIELKYDEILTDENIDINKYDYKIAKIIEFTGGAFIPKGNQADITAKIEKLIAEDLEAQKVLTYREREELPDSSFALIKVLPNGKKKRSLPYKDKEGNLLPSLIRNALARLNQVEGFTEEEKQKAKEKLQRVLKKINPDYEPIKESIENNKKEDIMDELKKMLTELIDKVVQIEERLNKTEEKVKQEEKPEETQKEEKPEETQKEEKPEETQKEEKPEDSEQKAQELKAEYDRGFNDGIEYYKKINDRTQKIKSIDDSINIDENTLKASDLEFENYLLKLENQKLKKTNQDTIVANTLPPPVFKTTKINEIDLLLSV